MTVARTARATVPVAWLVVLLCSLAPTLAQLAPEELLDDPQLRRALALLEKGRTEKAEKLLEQLEAERPQLIPRIRLLAAERANRRSDWSVAQQRAREAVELATDEENRIRATAELTVALAGSPGDGGTELTEGATAGLVELRRFLGSRTDDGLTDRLRVRLCRARELLPDAHPSSLSRPRLPTEGEHKYLPKSDPARGIESTKPQPIAQREIESTSAAASRLSGHHRASVDGVIDADGCFAGARVTSTSDDAFSPIALQAVRGWVYRPPRCNGEPVGMFFVVGVRMLQDDSNNKP